MQRDAIHDGSHAELSHTVIDMTTAVAMLVLDDAARQIDTHIRCGLGVGQVRAGQVGATAEQLGNGRGQGFKRQLTGFAAGHSFCFGIGCDHGIDHGLVEIGRQIPRHAAFVFSSQCGVCGCIRLEQLLPMLFLLRAFGLAVPIGVHISRHMKRLMRPMDGGSGQRDFVCAQRLSMCFGGVDPIGAALANVCFTSDEGGLVCAVFSVGDGLRHRIHIMAIDRDDVPAVGLETRGCVVDEPRRDLAVDGNAVVVIKRNQLVELPGTCQSASFVADAFHHAAVAQEDIGVMVNDVVVGAVEFGSQQFFCQRHAHRVGDALAERAGGGFHAGGDTDLGVTSGFAVQLAEVFQLAHRQVIASKVQQRIYQH